MSNTPLVQLCLFKKNDLMQCYNIIYCKRDVTSGYHNNVICRLDDYSVLQTTVTTLASLGKLHMKRIIVSKANTSVQWSR